MHARKVGKLALFGIALFLVAGCVATFECGTWVFTGTPSGDDFPLSSAFTFNPAGCSKSCDRSQDVMIQMTSAYNTDTRTYLYASDQPQGSRSTPYGWGIDRIDGAAHGYYGLQNDGTFASYWNTPGGNGSPNTLFDEPSGWPADTYFFAVDVATCYNSPTCNNTIVGYYFWSWYIDSSGNGHTFVIGPAWKDLDTTFQSALTAWNNWAPTSGTEDDGTGSFPHASPFPTLTDL